MVLPLVPVTPRTSRCRSGWPWTAAATAPEHRAWVGDHDDGDARGARRLEAGGVGEDRDGPRRDGCRHEVGPVVVRARDRRVEIAGADATASRPDTPLMLDFRAVGARHHRGLDPEPRENLEDPVERHRTRHGTRGYALSGQ